MDRSTIDRDGLIILVRPLGAHGRCQESVLASRSEAKHRVKDPTKGLGLFLCERRSWIHDELLANPESSDGRLTALASTRTMHTYDA
jgi:hypothetical protein